MRFTKMHGLGNDYVYVDCFAAKMPSDPAALARSIADRHLGVGGDGLILICPSSTADARMRMFNADGSESEMCGNGVRCVAKYVYDHGLAKKESVTIETGAGVLALDLEIDRDRGPAGGKVRRVRVDMGQPRLSAREIPVTLPGVAPHEQCVEFALDKYIAGWHHERWQDACGLEPGMTLVSMGNPHLVLFCRDVIEVPLATVGPRLERAGEFPNRINVHFVQIHSPEEVTMRTWERGSGITLACGTGASAVCVAGVLARRTGRHILAHLPGGDLELEWRADEHVMMTGPAVEVYWGEWPDEDCAR
ncbi:MAG TPA: diaminopimelate epimerase [Pirellulales bacterium]|jgi:diaminopimelate epimerase|nr:diaminopimelate epimerase [Pirellulales bacterium]